MSIYSLKQVDSFSVLTKDNRPSVFHGISLRDEYLKKYRHLLEKAEAGLLSVRFGLECCWNEDGSFDFQCVDNAENQLKEWDWTDMLMVFVNTDPPKWWLAKHPEEIQTQTPDATLVSLGSSRWREECGDALRKLMQQLEGSSILGRATIWRVIGGHTGEWFYVGGPMRYGVDRSPAMTESWRNWLEEKYGEESVLNKAWASKGLKFAEVNIPGKVEEMATDGFSFRDPLKQKKVVDFYDFYSQMVADSFIHFCRIVKEIVKDTSLVGGFYGHILDWIGNPFMACHIGQLRLSRALRSPYVDWIGWPNSYHKRGVGSESFFVSIHDSISLHGKLPLAELDNRTDLTKPEHEICGDRPACRPDTIAMMKRDFSKILTTTAEMLWLDLRGGWFDDPELMSLILQCRRIHKDSVGLDQRSNAEIAVLVDEDSHFYQGLRDTYVVDTFVSPEIRACDMLARIGAPYDIFLLNDIFEDKLKQYKMYVFPNTFYLDDRKRRRIDELLKKDSKTLVFMYAPGLIGEGGIRDEYMKNLSGIDLKTDRISCECFIRITDHEHPITKGEGSASKGWEENPAGGIILPSLVFVGMNDYFGVHKAIGPIIYSEDKEADVLGKYTYDDKVGFCAKNMPTWQSVFIGTPFVPPSILRGIASFAGVHVYNHTDDVCYISRNYIALHALGAGKRLLTLPQTSNVHDVFADEVVAKNVTSLFVDCPARSTMLLRVTHEK